MTVSDAEGFKLAIFDAFTLEMKSVIRDMPEKSLNFVIVSPKYNKYFKMKLGLLRKTYTRIMKNLTQEYETFKSQNLNQSPTLTRKRVALISSPPASRAASKASIKTLARGPSRVA